MKYFILLFTLATVFLAQAEEPSVKGYYQRALELRQKGDFTAAVECVAQGIALNQPDTEWLPKSELLSAQLYLDLNRFDAADVTARHIEKCYAGTAFAKEASALRKKIAQQKAASESGK